MSSETGRQIRVTIPVQVFEQIDRTAEALGISLNELGARCVVAGIGTAIAERIDELELQLAALKTEIEPAKEPDKAAPKTASPPAPKPGRAEQAAEARKEVLAEERRRGSRRKTA